MTDDKVKKLFEYWKLGSIDDFASAEDILTKTHRYAQGLFFIHFSIEKALKAAVVLKTKQHAPMTHNLSYLAQKAELTLNQDQIVILSEINSFNMSMRYPDQLEKSRERADQQTAQRILEKARELHGWIFQSFKS